MKENRSGGSRNKKNSSTRVTKGSRNERPARPFKKDNSEQGGQRSRISRGADSDKGSAPRERGAAGSRSRDDKPERKKPFPREQSTGGRTARPRKLDEHPSPRPPRKSVYSKKKELEETAKRGLRKGDNIRLNRFISNSGICSRREADQLIVNGDITVNEKVVTDLGVKITVGDVIKYKGKRITPEKPIYILLNKPRGYVTTVEDPHADRTVMELIEGACKERVYPVGRLDKMTTGILLFTNDGELAGRLTHPRYNKKKIYHVFLDSPLIKNDFTKLVEGIDLGDEVVSVDAVSYVDTEDKSQVGVELHTGQNRIVRNLFEALGYKVLKLDRVYFAGLTKKNLPRGKYRILTPIEINMLRRGLYK